MTSRSREPLTVAGERSRSPDPGPEVTPSFGLASRRLLQRQFPLTRFVQLLLTLGVVLATYEFALAVTGWSPVGERDRYIAVVGVLILWIVYEQLGVYQRFSGVFRGAIRISVAWTFSFLALLGLLLMADPPVVSRAVGVLALWYLSALFGQVVLCLLFYWAVHFWHKRLQVNLPAMIIGSGWLARYLARTLNGNAFTADVVTGFLQEDAAEGGAQGPIDGLPIFGSVSGIDRVLDEHVCDRVYIASTMLSMEEVREINARLSVRNIDVIWVPDIFSMELLNPSVREAGGLPLIALSESPLVSGSRAYFKALMDVCFALVALLIFGPVMIATAIAIKFTSEGPVFFRQPREGWDGVRFEILKFRSMYLHQEEPGNVTQAHEGDPRITPVGRIIRRLSIDELPQLFNVLGGSMSLVGPRPHAVAHNQLYSAQINAYLARHRIKPGITGWAQIHGLRGETRTLDDMRRRIQYDLEYINRWSLLLDLWILFATPFALLRHRGL